MELTDFFTVNLSNILLKLYKQRLVARRSTALAHRVEGSFLSYSDAFHLLPKFGTSKSS